MSTFGIRVWALRRAAGLSQTELAELIPLSHSALRAIEIHGAEPNLRTLRRLRAIFRVTYDFLVNDPAQLTAAELREQITECLKWEADGVGGAALAREQLTAQLRALSGGKGSLAREKLREQQQLELPAAAAAPARRSGGRPAR